MTFDHKMEMPPKAINPNGKYPALVDGIGARAGKHAVMHMGQGACMRARAGEVLLYESFAITQYLASKYPRLSALVSALACTSTRNMYACTRVRTGTVLTRH